MLSVKVSYDQDRLLGTLQVEYSVGVGSYCRSSSHKYLLLAIIKL